MLWSNGIFVYKETTSFTRLMSPHTRVHLVHLSSVAWAWISGSVLLLPNAHVQSTARTIVLLDPEGHPPRKQPDIRVSTKSLLLFTKKFVIPNELLN